MMPYAHPSDYSSPTLAEATADAFWDLDPAEISGSYELRIDDHTATGGVRDSDDGTQWAGELEAILEEWSGIVYVNEQRPNLKWA